MVSLLALSACAGQGGLAPQPEIAAAPKQTRVGLLLPLSGRLAPLGHQMEQAARLAISGPTAPILDVRDTDGAGGPADAARQALAAGDKILLGPLRTNDTAAAGPLAMAASVPMVAYTSDVTQARPGVWVFGLPPEAQVLRLVRAAHAEGKQKFAAFLPDSPLGHAMADGLTRACGLEGLEAPNIVFHASGADAIQSGLHTLSGIDERANAQGAVDPTNPSGDPALPATPAAPPAGATPATAPGTTGGTPPVTDATPPNPAPQLAPPPFDALLLGDVGLELAEVIGALKTDHVGAPEVRLMGPALWGAFAGKLGGLRGAWYATPDPADRAVFVSQFRQRYGASPNPVADLAYDTAALASAVSRPDGTIDTAALTRPDGFSGVDGLFTLQPDGHVARGLAIFEIQPGGGAKIAQPAPTRNATVHPGS